MDVVPAASVATVVAGRSPFLVFYVLILEFYMFSSF